MPAPGPGQRGHDRAEAAVHEEAEDELGAGALDEARQQRVEAPLAAEHDRHDRGHHLGEERGPGLADDQRRHHRGHEPHAADDVFPGFAEGFEPDPDVGSQAQKTTPNATARIATTMMSTVRQRARLGPTVDRPRRARARCRGRRGKNVAHVSSPAVSSDLFPSSRSGFVSTTSSQPARSRTLARAAVKTLDSPRAGPGRSVSSASG